MQTIDLQQLIIDAIEELKAKDITALDVIKLTSITDVMIICSGTSKRHVKSIADNVVEKAKKQKVQVIGTEGEDTSEWILIDLGDAVVHVMLPETRVFYQLEKLWGISNAKQDAQQNEHTSP